MLSKIFSFRKATTGSSSTSPNTEIAHFNSSLKSDAGSSNTPSSPPMYSLASYSFPSPKSFKKTSLSLSSPLMNSSKKLSSLSSPRSRSISKESIHIKRQGSKLDGLHLDRTKLGVTLRQVLDHPTLGFAFREFAASRFANEGILFLDQVLQPNASTSRLMEEFFLDGAQRWINLSDKNRTQLLSDYEAGNVSQVVMFTPVMCEVFNDLKRSDTFRLFCHENHEARTFANDVDIFLLSEWIVPENFRAVLALVEGDEILSNIVRFCCSVTEFERTKANSIQRRAQGNKICANFIQPGSRFQLEKFPTLYSQAILNGEYEHDVLWDARVECLQILSLETELMVGCRNVSSH